MLDGDEINNSIHDLIKTIQNIIISLTMISICVMYLYK